jgi:5-methylthioadenosine/S-adenosylhomocysteine deaminase
MTQFILTVKAALQGVTSDLQPVLIEDAALLISGGKVVAIGPRTDVVTRYPEVSVVSKQNAVAMPGLVNAHHHSGITPLQLGVPFKPLELWLPRFMGMRHVDARLDTLYSAAEMLESGTTTVHHIQGGPYGAPDAWPDQADAIISAYGEIGMRVSYSFMIRDQNQLVFEDDDTFLGRLEPEIADHFRPRLRASRAPIHELMAFFEDTKQRWEKKAPDSVRIQLAPANLHWCTDTALLTIFETARRHSVKLHMHLDETFLQSEYAQKRTGKTAIAHLADLGCLGPDLTIGHGIWADNADLDLLKDHGCCLCHNPSSGLRLASGIAPVNNARLKGIPVSLGIDQCGINDDRDMLQEMRVAWMLHREPGLFTSRPEAAEILKMATEHGASTTGFDREIGRLDPGCAADIVLIDWPKIAQPYLDNDTSLVDALLQRAKPGSIDSVYVGGELVVTEGRVCTINRGQLMKEIADAMAAPLSGAELEAKEMTSRLVPYIEQYYRDSEGDRLGKAYNYNVMAGGDMANGRY